MPPAEPATFRLLPRFRVLPWVCICIGVLLVLCALVFRLEGASLTFALACGAVGPLLGILYLAAPAWKYTVNVSDDALTVRYKQTERFRLPWSEVARVIASPSTKTLFLDGGERSRSLLVPGPGAPGPYRIEHRETLYDNILAHVPPDRVLTVDSLEGTGSHAATERHDK